VIVGTGELLGVVASSRAESVSVGSSERGNGVLCSYGSGETVVPDCWSANSCTGEQVGVIGNAAKSKVAKGRIDTECEARSSW
jgi:hypothetical protein